MGAFFTAIFQKIAAVAQWFIDLVKAVFTAGYDLAKDAACWVFDSLLVIVTGAVSALDLSAILQFTGLWASIPAGVTEVLAAIGLGSAFTIISAAIVVRLTLQLIPFTRLGS